MKKILAYISSAVAVLLSASCTERVDLFDAGCALSFEAQTTELETRAKYVPGEDKYHENEINTMDWFFFSDEEGTNLLYHQTTSGENANKLSIPEAVVVEKGLRGKSYLYAVANGPEGIASKTKLADILVMPVSTEFTKTEVDDEGEEALKLDVDNLKFIMDTYDSETKKYLKELSPKDVADGLAGTAQETIKVQLSRLAVKFSTKVKIAKSVTTTDTFGNTETWTPVLSQTDFDVYMMNALKAGTMSGEPIRRADEGVDQDNYFSYGRNLATVEELAAETDYYVWQTVDPFYTYPQKWNDTDNNEPYVKIIFPWMSDVKGSAEFHYKVVLPTPEDHVFTLDRNCWYKLTATIKILGGTESDYVLIDDVEVSVANWAEPWWSSGSGLNSAKYFYVPTKEFDVYSMDSFDIPINTNSSAYAYITEIKFNDYSASPTHNLVYSKGGRLGNNYVSSVSANTITGTNGDDNRVRFSGTEHAYSVTVSDTDRYNKYVTFTHSLDDIYVQRDITIYIRHSERSDWNETVIIHQHPAIELKKAVDGDGNLIAGDLFVNGRFASVKNATFGTNYGGFMHSNGGWTNSLGNNGLHAINQNSAGTNGYGCIIHENDIDWVDSPFFITDITVSSFSESNNFYKMSINGGAAQTIYYKIGDPRVKVSTVFNTSAQAPFNQNWTLHDYLTGESGSGYSRQDITSAWQNAGDILVASNDENSRNMIAPHILISSGLTEGLQGYSPTDYISYAKRGATYQEAGYPAGRWRMPTEAEIAFIAARQYDGTIPAIFNTDMTYFASSGRFVIIPSDKSKGLMYFTIDQLNQSATAAGKPRYTYADLIDAKYVYDVWYWGEETEAPNVYHANGHIE